MTAIDTGICAPETYATLLAQQRQLIDGLRVVQMFPAGTPELPLPQNCERYANHRGIYHFDPMRIDLDRIKKLSREGRENEFLNLGPFSKSDIARRARAGEIVTCITEYTADGIELRCVAATLDTVREQTAYFEATREPGSRIVIGEYPERVRMAFPESMRR